MPVVCVIEFDNNPYGIYYAGQVVTGKVTLQTEELKKVTAVILKIRGLAYTQWSEDTRTIANTKSANFYSGHEFYLQSTTYVMGSKESAPFNIESGTYSYDFSCQIPMESPSSFEGLHGNIRYTVAVYILCPWKQDNWFGRSFTVSRVLDLNYDNPLLYELANMENTHAFGIGPWKTDPLKISVSLPRSVYLPGQAISIDVLIKNESSVRVEEMKASLVMQIRYHDQPPSAKYKDQQIKVMKSKGEGVQRNCTKNFKYELLIPATPPTCLNLCRIIKITYMLEVQAKIKGFHLNRVVHIPITIGNIPPSTVMQPLSMSNADWHSSEVGACCNLTEKQILEHINATERTLGTLLEQHDYKNSPPPTFEEVMEMPEKNAASASDYTFDQKLLDFRFESGSQNAVDDKIVISEDEVAGMEKLKIQAETLCTNIPPPTFEEVMEMTENNAACARDYTFDQKTLDFRFESGSLKDIKSLPIVQTAFNTQQPPHGCHPPLIFEEAVHIKRTNHSKAFSPRYPVFRHITGPIIPQTHECNIDLSCDGSSSAADDKSAKI